MMAGDMVKGDVIAVIKLYVFDLVQQVSWLLKVMSTPVMLSFDLLSHAGPLCRNLTPITVLGSNCRCHSTRQYVTNCIY